MEQSFNISVDQKYGPLTTRRRQLAFKLRREMLDSGEIASAYVEFPAKLMVNFVGDVGLDNKKHYKLHKNFSKEPIEILSRQDTT